MYGLRRRACRPLEWRWVVCVGVVGVYWSMLACRTYTCLSVVGAARLGGVGWCASLGAFTWVYLSARCMNAFVSCAPPA
jgi:hypothetical protein